MGSVGVCHPEPIINWYESPFQTSIEINNLDKLDQDVIFSNYINSLSNFYLRECSKIQPSYKIKTQKIREKLLKTYPNLFIDYQRSNQWLDNLNTLNPYQLETLKVVIAIRKLDESLENTVLVSNTTCQSYIQANQGNIKQFWQKSYQHTLPILIERFNQTYEK